MLSGTQNKPQSTPRNAGGRHRSKRSPPARGRHDRAANLLRPAFKGAIWSTYDHIGLLVLANLLWVVLCLPVVTAPAATAGLFHLARQITRGRDKIWRISGNKFQNSVLGNEGERWRTCFG